jgi:nitrite reductase/ring-hydroxylating ferredoxin subunit
MMASLEECARFEALYNIDEQIYATHNVCTHAKALLSDGWLDHDAIKGPLHGGRFGVKTGKGLGPPMSVT